MITYNPRCGLDTYQTDWVARSTKEYTEQGKKQIKLFHTELS